jgi:serine/threonine protein phosphatase 1
MPRTIAIGDVHGCSAALAAVLEAVRPCADDTVVMLGDYIDRGPDSRGVIEQLLALGKQCNLVPLLGNHEVLLLAITEGLAPLGFWLDACGGDATVASYEGALTNIPQSHLDFLRGCRRHYETDQHVFLHANYVPALPLESQPDDVLFWLHLAQIPPPHISGKRAFVGHTPQRSGRILDAGHIVCIDTFCCGDGYLTAMDVDSGEIWQAEKGGVLLAAPV